MAVACRGLATLLADAEIEPAAVSAQMEPGPFHADELVAQRLAGGGASGAGIRNFMPDQHRDFFALLPYLFVATADGNGWPLATILTGPPGFISSPTSTRLEIAACPQPNDPAAPHFAAGQELGLLGLDFATRRRNRANGSVAQVGAGRFAADVQQSFGNCAQYIQRRVLEAQSQSQTQRAAEIFTALDDDLRLLIAKADTFFIASRARGDLGANGGLDISHRGGKPGFIRVDGDILSIPDFHGNRYYNTLGNLLGDPRASLLFLDFEHGDVVQLQGTAEIDWHSNAQPTGAERIWHFRLTRGWRRRAALPFRWRFIDYAPTTARTGTWHLGPIERTHTHADRLLHAICTYPRGAKAMRTPSA